jgi:hypothetical protein
MNAIEQFLKNNNESVNHLAKRAGIPQPVLFRLMKDWGKPYRLHAETAMKIHTATGIPFGILVNQP